jgi:hypothetical protein
LNPSFNITQVISALTHLDASHFVVSLETNLPRQPSRSNIALIQELMRTDAAPSLKRVITVDNSSGRVDGAALEREVVKYEDVFEDGQGRQGALLEEGEVLNPEDIVNIQFTSGLVRGSLLCRWILMGCCAQNHKCAKSCVFNA